MKHHSLLDLCHLYHIWNINLIKTELYIILLTYALFLVWVLRLEGRERNRQEDSIMSLICSNCLLSCKSDMDNKPNHNNLKMVGNIKHYIYFYTFVLFNILVLTFKHNFLTVNHCNAGFLVRRVEWKNFSHDWLLKYILVHICLQ